MNDDGDEKSNVGTMGDNIVIILYGGRRQLDLLWWSFVMCTNIESLCCIRRTNSIVGRLYINEKKARKKNLR